MRRLLRILWTPLLAASCAFAPEGAEEFTPPASYRAQWERAQACTGRYHVRFEGIRWYVVDSVLACSSGRCAGRYQQGSITIVRKYLSHPMIVRHEMIHALGVSGHPDAPFADPCRATWATWDKAEPRLQFGIGGSAGGLRK